MPRPLRWLAFRLGLLFSILALNLLAPLVLFLARFLLVTERR